MGENAEAYQRFLKMLGARKKLYHNPVIRKQIIDHLKMIEHELSHIQIKDTSGNHIHILGGFFDFITQCHSIYTNYVKYLPLCEDFEKL